MPAYQHLPLKAPDNVRLLKLAAGNGDDPLTCTIEHVDLTSKPVYDALSYVWGTPQKPKRLHITDDTYLAVTLSLFCALQDIRASLYDGTSHMIWADAVCINQSDVEERNLQVANMDSIYRCAARVITYIGEATDTSERGIEFAKELCLWAHRRQHLPPDLGMNNTTKFAEMGLPSRASNDWEALKSLMERPWATRIWIVQESLLNEKTIMLCGRRQLNWYMLGKVAANVTDKKLPSYCLPGDSYTPDCLSKLAYMRQQSCSGGAIGWPLLELLRRCHYHDSTDKRDRVFALLNIAKDRGELGIVADYKASLKEVYSRTAARLIQHYQSIDILSYVVFMRTACFPSWVPDWSRKPTTFMLANERKSARPYSVGGTAWPVIEVDSAYEQLTVYGAIIGCINYVSEKVVVKTMNKTPLRWHEWLEANRRQAQSVIKDSQNECADEVFWRTLVANRTWEQEDAPETFNDAFKTWVDILAAQVKSYSRLDLTSTQQWGQIEAFISAVWNIIDERCLYSSENGYIGLGPGDMDVGDVVCMFIGGKVPFVLRKEGTTYKLIGESYIHGVMYGEALEFEGLRLLNIVIS